MIKERLLRVMATFEPEHAEERRPRGYSQENLVNNEQSLMIENRSQASHGFALS